MPLGLADELTGKMLRLGGVLVFQILVTQTPQPTVPASSIPAAPPTSSLNAQLFPLPSHRWCLRHARPCLPGAPPPSTLPWAGIMCEAEPHMAGATNAIHVCCVLCGCVTCFMVCGVCQYLACAVPVVRVTDLCRVALQLYGCASTHSHARAHTHTCTSTDAWAEHTHVTHITHTQAHARARARTHTHPPAQQSWQ